MRERIKRLFLTELREKGISPETYAKLRKPEKRMLEKKGRRYRLKDNFRKKIKVVLTGGAFDIIHAGHVFTLKRAKEMGDLLVVVVARDEFLRRKKQRAPLHSQRYRKMIVESLKPVDIALIGFKDPRRMIKLVRPDIIVYGYDQPCFIKPKGIKIVKLKKRIEEDRFKTHRIIKNLGY